MSDLDAIHRDIRPLAEKLFDEGFVIYVAPADGLTWRSDGQRFFHYSTPMPEVLPSEIPVLYGTCTLDDFGYASVHMPVRPSKEHGSAVCILWRIRPDELTLNDLRRPLVRRTRVDATRRSPMLDNARPWGVPDRYRPVA